MLGGMPVLLTRHEPHRWEVCAVDRIREVLRLEAETMMLSVDHGAATASDSIEVVTRVKLHACTRQET